MILYEKRKHVLLKTNLNGISSQRPKATIKRMANNYLAKLCSHTDLEYRNCTKIYMVCNSVIHNI